MPGATPRYTTRVPSSLDFLEDPPVLAEELLRDCLLKTEMSMGTWSFRRISQSLRTPPKTEPMASGYSTLSSFSLPRPP